MFKTKSLRTLRSLMILIVGLTLLVGSSPSKVGATPTKALASITTQEDDWAESCTEIEPYPLSATALSSRIWTGKKVL